MRHTTQSVCLISALLGIVTVHRVALAQPAPSHTLFIRGATIIDGTGKLRKPGSIRIVGDTIKDVGAIKPHAGDAIIEARGLVAAPGFIDTHSHADGGLLEDPLAETQIRQGITTAIVGQDGGSNYPLKEWFSKLEAKHTTLNIASFVGHGTVRGKVTTDAGKRAVTPEELTRMQALVEQEMRAGGLGLSSGLEYDPGFYSTTAELVACASAAAKYGGMYISHVRDEGDEAFKSFDELIQIARDAHLPAQISHIKLDTSPAWNRAAEALQLIRKAKAEGLDISADVYPYTYWQSTIIVLIPTRNWDDRAAWQKGLEEVGGAEHVLLSTYTPDANWQGKTIAAIAAQTGKDAITIIQEIVKKTHAPGATGKESVVVTAMTEADVTAFVAAPEVMFCSDGGLKPSHPRGAGSFPRVLGYYAQSKKALTLEAAIHKMTGLPAARMHLANRGRIAPGMKADITLFDPTTVHDTATTAHPAAPPIGIPYVIVNGSVVLAQGKFTGSRPGAVLRHSSSGTR